MIYIGLAALDGKQSVREVLTFVGHRLDGFDRAGFGQCNQETAGAGGCIVLLECREYIACGPVDGYEQTGPAGFSGDPG